MRGSLKLWLVFIGAALVFGCASQKSGVNTTAATGGSGYVWHKAGKIEAPKENDPADGKKIVNKAYSAIGTPYVYGGTKPGGFDCSGLVKWTYNSVGVELPRTAREQSTVGKKINNVKDMRPGDIVAFRHPKRGYHTGIYMGNGKFIHSPRRRTTVRINSLDDNYYNATLLGARRIDFSATGKIVAEAESRLDQFIASRHKTLSQASAAAATRLEKNNKNARNNDRIDKKAAKGKNGKKSMANARSAKSSKKMASRTDNKSLRKKAAQATKGGVKIVASKGNAKTMQKSGVKGAKDNIRSGAKQTGKARIIAGKGVQAQKSLNSSKKGATRTVSGLRGKKGATRGRS